VVQLLRGLLLHRVYLVCLVYLVDIVDLIYWSVEFERSDIRSQRSALALISDHRPLISGLLSLLRLSRLYRSSGLFG